MRRNIPEEIGHVLIVVALFLASIATLYPFWHVLMYSISDGKEAMNGGIFLVPRGFSLAQYSVLIRSSNMFTSFRNSVLLVLIGVPFNLVMTASLAFPLANKKLIGRGVISIFVFLTMLFSGGLIPSFLVNRMLGLYDNPLVLILPSAISAYNMFVMRSFFVGLPVEMEESALLDGAGPTRVLFSIVLPLSKPVLAALAMFYGVGHWNNFFTSLIYIESPKYQVFQNFLRSMLLQNSYSQLTGIADFSDLSSLNSESVKMAAIVLSVIPVLLVYPFLQKYYVKGLTMGSVKG